jgi:hypothetical protein
VRGSLTEAQAVGPQWTRLISAGQLQDTADSISFGIALNPGTTVDVFGFQVEAQIAASLYKETSETSGVYPNARFQSDAFTITTVGPDRNSCELDIVNVEYL